MGMIVTLGAESLKKSIRSAVVICSLWLVSSAVLAETMFDPVSGQLIIPVLDTGGERYSAVFERISDSPPAWRLVSAEPIVKDSRTAATFQSDTSTLWVPEINVEGRLYNLSFDVASECAEGTCIEAQIESLQDLGRSGSAVFTEVASTASTFTCSTCHAITESEGFAADGFRRPGHPLLNAPQRPDFKNGELETLLEAVNICRTEWMNTTAWNESDQEWLNLLNWLNDQSTVNTAEPVISDVLSPPADLSGGDIEAGLELMNTRCVVCHGENGEGTERAPKINGLGLDAEYIGRRVRTSGRSDSAAYVGLTGGVMPFWAADRLSDGELADIVAYLQSGELDTVNVGTNTGSGAASNCTSNHSKVGLSARLTERFHNVSGLATIVDDCTIEITEFFYDGGGINVHVYAGNELRFHEREGGFSIKSGLLGTAYFGGTLTITLPDDVTLDDFDSISIWCVPVGSSFGDAQFVPST